MVWIGARSMSSASICVTALPISRRRCSCPVAVTTMAPSSSADDSRRKSATTLSPAVSVTWVETSAYPSRVARTSWTPTGTLGRMYRPSLLVRVRRVVPATTTWTPLSGSCVWASITCPAMAPLFWADAGPANSRTTASAPTHRTNRDVIEASRES
jgi:hypothetical protein